MNTMKRITALALVLMMLCSVTACKKGTESDSSVAGEQMSSLAEDDASAADDASSEEVASTEATDNSQITASTTTASKPVSSTTQDDVWGNRKPTSSTAKSDRPKVIDMKGATITLGTKWITDWGNGDPGDSALGDKWIAWRKDFEKKYNCKIKNIYVSPYTLFSSLATKLMSGDKVADVITMQLFDVEAFRHAGLLQEWQKVPDVNLDHPMVSQSLLNNFTYNGKSYMLPYATVYNEVNGVYVNMDMIKELKLDDPFELVRQKKWTWSAMDKMSRAAYKDTNKNNKVDSADRFGISFGSDFALGTLRVSGIQVISYNKGKFTYSFNNAKTLNALNAIKDTIKAGNRACEPDENIQKKFVQGGLLFMCGDSGAKTGSDNVLWDADFEMGFLPCPTHQEEMEYTNTCTTWLGGLAVPVNVDEKSRTNLSYLLESVLEMQESCKAEQLKQMQRALGKESYDLYMTYQNKFTVDAYCWQNEFKDLVKQNMDDTLFDNSVTPAKYLETIDTPMKNAVKDYYGKDPDLIS